MYTVTPLKLAEHRDSLARLWSEMSDDRIASVVPERMSWLYEQGPDGPTTTVLGLHVESGTVVGCGSFFSRPTWIAGNRVRAGVLCDFAVTATHRIGGAAIAIQRSLLAAGRAAGLDLLYGYPNAKSLPILKRIGYQVIGETTTWVKPIRSAYKLRERLPWPWAVSLAAPPVDLGLRALDRIRSARTRPRMRGNPLSVFDERADELWERARSRYCVVGEKSSAYLDWRYRRFTTIEHEIFGVAGRAGSRLEGYVVFTVENNKALLRDLFVDGLDGSVDALLLELVEHLRSRGISSVSLSFIGGNAFGARLRKLGFLLRPERRALVLHPDAVPEQWKARLLDPESWFMLDGELDI